MIFEESASLFNLKFDIGVVRHVTPIIYDGYIYGTHSDNNFQPKNYVSRLASHLLQCTWQLIDLVTGSNNTLTLNILANNTLMLLAANSFSR